MNNGLCHEIFSGYIVETCIKVVNLQKEFKGHCPQEAVSVKILNDFIVKTYKYY